MTDNSTFLLDVVTDRLKSSGKIASVTFVKKDGTLRNMRFIAAQSKSYEAKGCPIAAKTIEANPHLFRVIDLEAYTKGRKEGFDKQTAMSKAFRQFNALTLTRVKMEGKEWNFSRDGNGSVSVTVS
jgi:hypothetical protein